MVLSVAGLDPCGGAGLISDVRTFAALGAYGMGVACTVTFQSPAGLRGRHDLLSGVVIRQLSTLFEDCAPAAVKTGALGSADNARAVADFLRSNHSGFLVVDPVGRSGDGKPLMDEAAMGVLVTGLIPRATVVTPNASEVELVCGFQVFDIEDMKAAALRMVEMGARAALVTGGRVEGGSLAADVLCEGGSFTVFTAPWVEGLQVHGTGCVLSAAVAALLARGEDVAGAVSGGIGVVREAIRKAVKPGGGSACAFP